MPKKDCGNHGSYYRHKLYRRIFACVLSLIILVLFVILVIWLVLRPTKPKFLLQDVSVYQFDLSGTNSLSSNLQITISSRNPNDRIGIYYDRLDIYAEYHNQQITGATSLPTGYQGHNDVNIWSPYLNGVAVPVYAYIADTIGQDENAGLMLIYIKINGRLRWKVGSWISGHYHIDVNCPAFLAVDNSKGNGGSASFRFLKMTSCSVEV
ncbi:Putative syntaxin-24 [Apostasia shenzhenica]|uniref:Syntaxin-24 n=1 Tax=Apostasia shenzhenica TaxID=1088818 RepID=A0A2I0BGC3_9ASPA|nr:Putative syntaxin-24 [Apostasia shenzhenica]